jgi:hypothetical protein
MPYLLDISSRVIESVDQVPGDIEDWTVSKFHIKRLLNDQHPHELDWEDVTIGGLLNEKDKLLILQDRDSAFDIEYWTRCSDWLGQQRRELVDYSDLDAPEITDDMYVSNLVRQYPHLDPKLPVNVLERIIDAFRK